MTASATVQPVQRQDVHKACRTLETLLSVLSDYCDAASSLAAVQKKLARALKDAAGLKTNAHFAASAFGASSSILEVLADVDGKFAKIVHKESHSVSSDLEKWLDKLAKEEKAHDDHMNKSNARIKQAGQAYEEKSKKGGKDAAKEHARYIDLLSVIGPEMSQEKYNHAVQVTRQNSMVTFNVAATLCRIADAEWSRVCECVRRISPSIGPLGASRSLCEGAWSGPLPKDLPETSSPTPTAQMPAISEWGQNGLSTPRRRSLPIPPVTAHSVGSMSAPPTAALEPPCSPLVPFDQNQGSINSITTLSAFPFPPTHFPVPLAMNETELQHQQIQFRGLQSAHSRATSPNPTPLQAIMTLPATIVTDSPRQMATIDLSESHVVEPSKVSHSMSTCQILQSPTDAPPRADSSPAGKDIIKSAGEPKKLRRPSLVTRVPPPSDKASRPVLPFKRGEHSLSEKEFGLHEDTTQSVFKSHSVDTAEKHVERADSTRSTGSHVAALRNRITRAAETSSQGPKDVPRLPMSVVEIASRYLPSDEPVSPRRAASPMVDRFPPDTHQLPRDAPLSESEIRRRQQRIEGLAELEIKEKEHELRQRERELDQRTRELERDRLHFLARSPDPADGPKGPRNSPFQHKRGSQSVTHVNLPSTTSSLGSGPTPQTRPSTAHHSPTRSPVLPQKDHAPFCGCGTCSVSKYKTSDASPTPRDLRPPEPPIVLRADRPKGWIRRLSMPSVNMAFSLDAKKNASALSLKAGLPLPAENGQLRKRSFDRGISNRTVTGVGR